MSWDLKGKEISVFITGNFSADFIKIEARYKNRRQRIIKCFCILLSADNNDLKRIRDMNFKDLKQLCLSHGFTNVAPLACDTIELKPEVRQMCGTLEECKQRVRKYKLGILVQTVGQLEDSMDGEGMMRTEAMHKASFYSLEKDLRKFYPNMLPIGAGCCTKCKTCTCPDAPCRFPDQAFSSMEAYGMLVMQVCQANHLDYYYGPGKIAYTSCYLLK